MNSIVGEKSEAFAVRIVRLTRYLTQQYKETVLSRQLLRAGTSIGANIAEALQAQSHADFVSKMNIALKEATETDYWLRVLWQTDYLTKRQFESVFADCNELERLLISILKTAKDK